METTSLSCHNRVPISCDGVTAGHDDSLGKSPPINPGRFSLWTAPNCSYYNASSCTSQQSNDANHYVYVAWSEPGSCVDQMQGEIYAVGSTWAEVWDLDDNWPDEYLNTLQFPATNILVNSCDAQQDTCSRWAKLAQAS